MPQYYRRLYINISIGPHYSIQYTLSRSLKNRKPLGHLHIDNATHGNIDLNRFPTKEIASQIQSNLVFSSKVSSESNITDSVHKKLGIFQLESSSPNIRVQMNVRLLPYSEANGSC